MRVGVTSFVFGRAQVLDEADRLFEQGCADFTADLEVILEAVPARRQTLLFSATLTATLAELKNLAMNKPFFWEAESEYVYTCSAEHLTPNPVYFLLFHLLAVSFVPPVPFSLVQSIFFGALPSQQGADGGGAGPALPARTRSSQGCLPRPFNPDLPGRARGLVCYHLHQNLQVSGVFS